MMENELISVVVPTYKRKPDLIKRAINSILLQTYKNIELLVIDDSPEEFEYRKDIEKFIKNLPDNRIRYIKHDKNMGANKARNTGIKFANGEYIAFLDDDDEWLPEKLQLQLQKFTPDVGLVYCKAEVIDEISGSRSLIINEIKEGNYYEELLKQNFIGSNSFVLIKKCVLDELGSYDEELLSNQDYDLFLRIARNYKISGVDKVLVRYYIHSGDRISTNNYKQLQGRQLLYKKFYKDIIKNQYLTLVWEIKMIPLLYKNNEKQKAILKLFRLILSHPYFVIKYLGNTIRYIQLKKKLRE